MSVIDLQQVRADREAPDGDCVQYDDFGRPMYLFALEYEMDGSTWSSTVLAYSAEDAQRRVDAMRGSLAVRGQIYSIMPA